MNSASNGAIWYIPSNKQNHGLWLKYSYQPRGFELKINLLPKTSKCHFPSRDDVARKNAGLERKKSFLSFVQEMFPWLTITEMRKEGQQVCEQKRTSELLCSHPPFTVADYVSPGCKYFQLQTPMFLKVSREIATLKTLSVQT